MIGRGRFVLVVGPSGAGKDTLISGARIALRSDPRFVFPERLITRAAAPGVEAHKVITRAEFERRCRSGDCALSWQAHGFGYIVPASAAADIAAGRIAVCNVSRNIVPEALARYPGTEVVFVDALRIIRATRLAERGRESVEQIEARLTREVPKLPDSVPVTEIDNSGARDEGIAALVAALNKIAGAGVVVSRDKLITKFGG